MAKADPSTKKGAKAPPKAKKAKASDLKEKTPKKTETKTAATVSPAAKDDGGQSWEERILQALFKRYRFGKVQPATKKQIAKALSCHFGGPGFVAALKNLEGNDDRVVKEGNGYVLTEAGAVSLGYEKKELSGTAVTDEQLQNEIKATLNPKWKGALIIDLFAETPVTRKELAEKAGLKSGTHSFSYGLKELKDFGFVGPSPDDKKKLCLTDECFVQKQQQDAA